MTSLLERLKSALADRYDLESEIGRGGMAVVYLANDLKHRRPVAIKVLLPELAASIGAERFLREIDIATGLVHPHVIPIFDAGEVEGLLYYVMPYVDGESLRERLDREKQLPLEDALRIAEQVADVLSYAHDQAIVHRDIKPENILFEADHAVVTDFGVARAITTAGGEKLTQTGLAVGTPAYMSPEQASGDGRVDGRADQYALGCLLYEMLAGDPPFTGATAQVILARKSTDAVPALRSARETVSAGVEAVIAKSLAKSPADRYATIREFAIALRNPPRLEARRRLRRWGVAVAVVLVALGAWAVLRPFGAEAVPVVAVIPCESAGRAESAGGSGIRWTEDLITALYKTHQLRPRSWATMKAYDGAAGKPAEIAAEQRADFFLTCRVEETSEEVLLRAEFVRTEDEHMLWTDDLRGPPTVAGVISLRSEAVQAIIAAAGAPVTGDELESLTALPTNSDSAYELYLRGRDAFNEMTAESLSQSLDLYGQAISIDSTFAEALAARALSLELYGQVAELPPKEYFPEVKRELFRALQLDERIGAAHTLLGYYQAGYDWDWLTAELHLRRGVELDPANAIAHVYYAQMLTNAGRHDEAIDEMRVAVDLEPTSSFVRANLAARHMFAEQLSEARSEIDFAVTMDSGWVALWVQGNVRSALNEYDAAVESLESAYKASDYSGVLFDLASAYAGAGRRAEAESLLATLLPRGELSFVDPARIAQVYVSLGEHEKALDWLERAVDDRSYWVTFIFGQGRSYPFDPLRSDPRFQALKTHVGFAL